MAKKEGVRVAMVTAASQALDYVTKNPNADTEEVLRHIMTNMHVRGDEKVGAIVGANKALKEKQQSGKANRVIVQDIMDQSEAILASIGEN